MQHHRALVLLRIAGHLHWPAPIPERMHGSIDRGSFHSRRSFQPLEQLLEKTVAAGEVGISLLIQRDAHRKQAVGANAEVGALYCKQCANHEARADQEHERERHLRDHQSVAHPALLWSARTTAVSILQR